MDESSHKLTYPCDFPVKIIAENKALLMTDVKNIITKHFPSTKKKHYATRLSRNGQFLSITVVLHVKDPETLDDLHQDLKGYPGIKMVL